MLYNNPYQSRLTAFQQPQMSTPQLIRVNGIRGAEAYYTPPSSTVALFDENSDTMFIKTTDAGGYPSLRKFKFSEIQDVPVGCTEYVTREEFEKLKGALQNVEQLISSESKSSQANSATSDGRHDTAKG